VLFAEVADLHLASDLLVVAVHVTLPLKAEIPLVEENLKRMRSLVIISFPNNR